MAEDATKPSADSSKWEDKGNGELILKNKDAVRPKPQSFEELRKQLQKRFGLNPE